MSLDYVDKHLDYNDEPKNLNALHMLQGLSDSNWRKIFIQT